jgi:hypothetical protein
MDSTANPADEMPDACVEVTSSTAAQLPLPKGFAKEALAPFIEKHEHSPGGALARTYV